MLSEVSMSIRKIKHYVVKCTETGPQLHPLHNGKKLYLQPENGRLFVEGHCSVCRGTWKTREEAEKALENKVSGYSGKVVPVYVKPSTKQGPYVIRWRNRDGKLSDDDAISYRVARTYSPDFTWGPKSAAFKFDTWQAAWDHITLFWGINDPNKLPRPVIIRLKKPAPKPISFEGRYRVSGANDNYFLHKSGLYWTSLRGDMASFDTRDKAVVARGTCSSRSEFDKIVFGEDYYVNRSTRVIKHPTRAAAQAVCPDGCVTVGPLYGNVCEHPTT
jgi:hypothetical protein